MYQKLVDRKLTKKFLGLTKVNNPLSLIISYMTEGEFNALTMKHLFKYIGVQELTLTKAFNIVVNEFELAKQNHQPVIELLKAIQKQTQDETLKNKCQSLMRCVKLGFNTVGKIDIPWYLNKKNYVMKDEITKEQKTLSKKNRMLNLI